MTPADATHRRRALAKLRREVIDRAAAVDQARRARDALIVSALAAGDPVSAVATAAGVPVSYVRRLERAAD